jgi:hypothetical protein
MIKGKKYKGILFRVPFLLPLLADSYWPLAGVLRTPVQEKKHEGKDCSSGGRSFSFASLRETFFFA